LFRSNREKVQLAYFRARKLVRRKLKWIIIISLFNGAKKLYFNMKLHKAKMWLVVGLHIMVLGRLRKFKSVKVEDRHL